MKRIVDLSAAEKEHPENNNFDGKEEGWLARWPKFLIFLKGLALVVLAVAIWRIFIHFNRNFLSNFPEVDSSKYQVVFLQNNLVYFGKLSDLNKSYAVMKSAYYFKSQDAKTGLNLIKLVDEIHKPEDNLFIPKSQILFWENLSADSPVVRIITQQDKK